jgi:hypothetical protein
MRKSIKLMPILLAFCFIVGLVLQPVVTFAQTSVQIVAMGIYVNDQTSPKYLTFQQFRALTQTEKKVIYKVGLDEIKIVTGEDIITLAKLLTVSDSALAGAMRPHQPSDFLSSYSSGNGVAPVDGVFEVIAIN